MICFDVDFDVASHDGWVNNPANGSFVVVIAMENLKNNDTWNLKLYHVYRSNKTLRQIIAIITHPLITARFYWLLYVMWYKITGQFTAIIPVCVDIILYYIILLF